mgnify:FL=1
MAIVINGSGTVTGLAVGGLPDGTVDDGTVASGITSSKLTGALPAISGAALTGVGVDGIVSNANATAITIDSAERVGIGVTDPDMKLEVNGQIKIDSAISGDNIMAIINSASDGYGPYFKAGGGNSSQFLFKLLTYDNTEKFRVDGNGRVGIGTTVVPVPSLLSLGQDSGSGDSAASSGITFKTSDNDDMFQISTAGGANNAARGLKFSADGTERMRMSAEGALTKPHQPAFAANVSTTYSLLVSQIQDIPFATEIFDQNADFNTSTYTFTAPVTGKYQLNLITRVDNMANNATYYHLYLFTSNRTYFNIIDPRSLDQDPAYLGLTVAALADMDAGDTATAKFYQAGGTEQSSIASAGDSSFSGFLAC